nr:sialate O-acetylesterase [Candidatus Sigynarchaeum springense]MDO8116211.1 sialate O-acetylesterase [Candidatus Sigynarchaeota archaeon]
MAKPAFFVNTPLDRAVYQRGPDGRTRILVTGTVKGISMREDYRLACETTDPDGIPGPGGSLRFSGKRGWFAGSVTLPAGGWYQFRLTLRDASGGLVCSAVVDHVGVGEVFITAGQSNAANSGTTRLAPKSDLVSARGLHGWQVARDPQPVATNDAGSPWPAMADMLVDVLHVPVGLISVGVGGTAVATWIPDKEAERHDLPWSARLLSALIGALRLDWNRWPWLARLRPKTANFSRLAWALKIAGVRGARAVLWHQGESDSIARTPAGIYAKRLRAVIGGSRAAAGWNIPWLIARASFHVAAHAGDMHAVAKGQERVVNSVDVFQGPATDDLIGEQWRAPDRVHFNGAGLAEHGRRWARAVLETLFKE